MAFWGRSKGSGEEAAAFSAMIRIGHYRIELDHEGLQVDRRLFIWTMILNFYLHIFGPCGCDRHPLFYLWPQQSEGVKTKSKRLRKKAPQTSISLCRALRLSLTS